MSVEAPPPEIVRKLYPVFVWFIPRAKWLLDAGGGVVTSWWRSPSENDRVGGDPNSQHLVGLAFDWVGDFPAWTADAAEQLDLIAVQEGDHVHIQVFTAGRIDVHRYM